MKKIASKIIILCILYGMAFLFFGNVRSAQNVYAASTDNESEPTTQTTESTETTQTTQSEKTTETVIIPAVTEEPLGSDLTLLHGGTRLDAKRWVQSFTTDGTYYYFVQMTGPAKGNLRITRVKYSGKNLYVKDHMDLIGFGHGTNIDCSVYKGKTYLWIGSNMNSKSKRTQSISCFRYRKNKRVYKKAGYTYTIRMKGSKKKMTNVFPAVSQDSKYLYVRYTYKHKQYYQKYKIYKGCKINSYAPRNKIKISETTGEFQGFDVYKNSIYTIEGSPTAVFLKSYDKTRKFYPTIIRITNCSTRRTRRVYIKGASSLTFREPEGIKITKSGRVEILFVSNTLTNMYCNIYKVK